MKMPHLGHAPSPHRFPSSARASRRETFFLHQMLPSPIASQPRDSPRCAIHGLKGSRAGVTIEAACCLFCTQQTKYDSWGNLLDGNGARCAQASCCVGVSCQNTERSYGSGPPPAQARMKEQESSELELTSVHSGMEETPVPPLPRASRWSTVCHARAGQTRAVLWLEASRVNTKPAPGSLTLDMIADRASSPAAGPASPSTAWAKEGSPGLRHSRRSSQQRAGLTPLHLISIRFSREPRGRRPTDRTRSRSSRPSRARCATGKRPQSENHL